MKFLKVIFSFLGLLSNIIFACYLMNIDTHFELTNGFVLMSSFLIGISFWFFYFYQLQISSVSSTDTENVYSEKKNRNILIIIVIGVILFLFFLINQIDRIDYLLNNYLLMRYIFASSLGVLLFLLAFRIVKPNKFLLFYFLVLVIFLIPIHSFINHFFAENTFNSTFVNITDKKINESSFEICFNWNNQQESLTVSEDLFDAIQKNQLCTINTQKGLLGVDIVIEVLPFKKLKSK